MPPDVVISVVVTRPGGEGHVLEGRGRSGECWFDAARRLIGVRGGVDPVALDLSGPNKRFTTAGPQVGLGPASRADLPHLSRWRSASHVEL